MKVDRGPILATLAIVVVLSLAACVSPFEPESDSEETEPDEGVDFTASQVYSGGMLVHAGPPVLLVTNG